MQIDFDNPKHEDLVDDFGALSKKFDRGGQKNADDILTALEVLRSAEALSDVPRSYRPHPLKAEYKGFFVIDVTKTRRIIFKPNHDGDPNFRIDNYQTINSITVVEIFKDYH